MAQSLHLTFIIFLSAIVSPIFGLPYLEIPFDTAQKFGYDGPWYTVPVSVGSNEQTVNLFPGGQYSSYIISVDACAGNSNCVSEPGGLYSAARDDSTYNGTIGYYEVGEKTIPYGDILEATGARYAQFAQLRIGSGFSRTTISNVSISRIDEVSTRLGKTKIGMSNGFLSLGAVDDANSFGPYKPVIPLNNLAINKVIPSKSWAMHYASTKFGETPSLIWGGYDSSRIAGPLQRFDVDGSNGDRLLNLLDIGIGTAIGKSPFEFENKTNLLDTSSKSNSRSSSGIKVSLDTILPYLLLPESTCEALANELPVTYSAQTGLYLWNTGDTAYKRIVKSPAYLSFTFRVSPSQNFTIKVPFALLDLTLEPPLVSSPQAYFPCKLFAPSDPEAAYVLGRAFHQAAFVAHTYNTFKFWIAQATGPNVASSNIRSIGENDAELEGPETDENTWISSWDSTWTVTPNADSPSKSDFPNSSQSSNGLSPGATAGIGAGVGALAMLLLVGAYIYWRKRQSRLPNTPTPTSLSSLIPLPPGHGRPDGAQTNSVKGYTPYEQYHQHALYNNNQEERHELPGTTTALAELAAK